MEGDHALDDEELEEDGEEDEFPRIPSTRRVAQGMKKLKTFS